MGKGLHFTVGGEFLTGLSRRLWADEGEPEKALRILEAAFPEMRKEDVFCVLTGSKKLVGDSDNGILLEDDAASESECGNSLALEAVLRPFRKRGEAAKDWMQFATQQTEFVPSRKGLIEVPRGRTSRGGLRGARVALKDDVELDEIPHRECNAVRRREKFYDGDTNRQRMEKGIEEAERPPPPKPERSITQDDGWLAPDGLFYPCAYGEHNEVAWRLEESELRLEKRGWVKVQEGKFLWDFLGSFTPTQAQIDVVFDFCKARGVPMPSGFMEGR